MAAFASSFGTLALDKVDERGWGWQVKASMSPATPRPLYNKAKELLLQERMPRDVAIAHPRAEEVKIRAVEGGGDPQSLRRLKGSAASGAMVF